MSEPFFETAEDASRLKWQFTDHRDGETARFAVCGLHVHVQDCDGDYAEWSIRKGRRGPVVAEGTTRDFFASLHNAEIALRSVIAARIEELRLSAQALFIGGR
ncbi:hypothetical protein [Methylorubrum thiocyanatum]|uniref:hypothetical protein n=1 Tax=Methylorubrum thiocyanatum TaxID=47958 RepID=UPI0035C813FE